MAQTKKGNGGQRANSRKKTTGNRGNSGRTASARKDQRKAEPMDTAIRNEIFLIGLFAVCIFLFVCNFRIAGTLGNAISDVMFGIFGLLAYVMPLALFLMIAFGTVNNGNSIALRKLIAIGFLALLLSAVFELFTGAPLKAQGYQPKEIFEACKEGRNGGGIIGGSVAYGLYHFLGVIGTVLVILVAAIISVVVVTERSFVSGVKTGSRKVYERSRQDAAYRKEKARLRREELEEERAHRIEEKKLHQEELENEKILRMDKKVSGVMLNTTLTEQEENEKGRDDLHEINLTDFDKQMEKAVRDAEREETETPEEKQYDSIPVMINGAYDYEEGGDELSEITGDFETMQEPLPAQESAPFREEAPGLQEQPAFPKAKAVASVTKDQGSIWRDGNAARGTSGSVTFSEPAAPKAEKPKPALPKKYIFPPLNLLVKGQGKNGDSSKELRETARRLQQTLETFGVKVTITDISQGPAVTRFELQPEQGVKVSKIVGLSDDIKLNLAATDIRIEAPIPGKAAIGIEVPNKENSMVALRDLLESREFKEFPSNLAFAVGKDIGGKVVVADIAKMPHMLIAGATGSGKSVCINTLIMSIIYKSNPEDVKLIMVDPKVVELSVYNGIPHLLIPVVTDPKKASAALQWGVAEMTDRYQKFADFNVRDLKGYNKKLETMTAQGESDVPAKMPQIVIIVDELADLMMVSPGEVEESICRLAQLARAAGIHLIIATQRPSVDVITGLIKANMPSRVAFSVSSGVDSRTILDMNGAEKLLGKGDMLFYPQGYTKPARVQGAFVSDKEVSDVVEFLKNQALGNVYDPEIQDKIAAHTGGGAASGGSEGGNERDQYFEEAGRFIIEKEKASIGMLQRVFKIGFNRAARIMDQLCEAGVVGEEEGTKPRRVLMSMEQFEQYIEEVL